MTPQPNRAGHRGIGSGSTFVYWQECTSVLSAKAPC